MANTYKVKRGMVFWHNLDERVDKNSNPTIMVNGKEYHDHRQYGIRHWLVISNDDGNFSSPTCNVVPITGASSKANIPTHVPITYRGRQFEILCEQIMTVNSVSLRDYVYMVSDSDMRNVEKALAIQHSIWQMDVLPAKMVEEMLLRVERRIENMINRYESHIKSVVKEYEGQLAAISASDTIAPANPTKKKTVKKESDHPTHIPAAQPAAAKSSVPHVSTDRSLSQIEKFNARYPGISPENEPAAKPLKAPLEVALPPQKAGKRKWTRAMMLEYLNDTNTLTPARIAEKWDFKDIRIVYSMKHYLRNRLKKFPEMK